MSLFVMAQILSTNATRIKRCGFLVAWTLQDYILSKAGLVIPIFYSSLLSILLSTSMVSSTSSKNPHGCGGPNGPTHCLIGISNLSEASPVQVPFVESKNFRVNNSPAGLIVSIISKSLQP
mmetsp:Transcript_22044/g.25299  ORF Transcript_22044/g.25299 Transcript_22044/m.25299 type:complete len:121 (-) Transcript_22044:543-905(-)